jgi:hypothetical protein
MYTKLNYTPRVEWKRESLESNEEEKWAEKKIEKQVPRRKVSDDVVIATSYRNQRAKTFFPFAVL